MSKVKVKSLKVIKQYLLWASSSAVIFILLLCLLVACNPNRYSASTEQQAVPSEDARQNKHEFIQLIKTASLLDK